MSEARYRLLLRVSGKAAQREVMLDSAQPVVDILNWLEDEYDFKANLKKIYLVRDDGGEEQIY